MKSFMSLFAAFFCITLNASPPHVARIVKLQGNSEVYIPGESKEHKNIKYLDQTFHVVPATRGMKLDNGFVLTTKPDSKVKVIYRNGDHFFVDGNTQYTVSWERRAPEEKQDPSMLILIRGTVRGMVTKDGPRSGIKVKTKQTAFSVRGTDFYVHQRGTSGTTVVSVLRGSIEIKPENEKKTVIINSGETFIQRSEKEHLLDKITKQDLKKIDHIVKIETKAEDKPEMVELEKKATEVVLKDIKEYQPELYEKVKTLNEVNSEQLASNTIQKLEVTAPMERRKPTLDDLQLDEDPYEKYKFSP